MNKMDVLLIDDHQLVNHGLASLLEGTGRFTVSGQAATLAEARHFIETSAMPSLIVLDILLGADNGLDFLPFLQDFCKRKKLTKPPVLVCSVIEDPFRIRTAFHMGAAGFIAKSNTKEQFLTAIDTVLNGEKYACEAVNEKPEEAAIASNRFTKREQELLNLIKQNKTNQEIAKTLGLSLRTIENYIGNIYFKTGTSTRQELILL